MSSASAPPAGNSAPVYAVLFVCTGNICRSPTAEAVLRAKLKALHLADRVLIESAGVQGWHAGSPPDDRSQDHARRRGYELCDQRARVLRPNDFERFDLVVAMDGDHLRELRRLCPPAMVGKIGLLPGETEIPDPYYGGAEGFEEVLDLIEQGCETIARNIARKLVARRG